MSNRFDELAKGMAKGMSRRSAVRVFFSGLGAAVAGIFLGRGTAQAHDRHHEDHDERDKHEDLCERFCEEYFGRDHELFERCCEESEECHKDSCAFTYAVNSTVTWEENWICVRVNAV